MFGNRKPPAPPVDQSDRGDRMQRVRVGLTGLAVVLILIVLASFIFAQVSTMSAPEQAAANAAVAGDKASDEPLADLGIAPGAPDNSTK